MLHSGSFPWYKFFALLKNMLTDSIIAESASNALRLEHSGEVIPMCFIFWISAQKVWRLPVLI